MTTWEHLKEQGWGLLRVDEENGSGKKIKVFLAPFRKGKRRQIRRKTDLEEQDKKYGNFLFSGNNDDKLKEEVMALLGGREEQGERRGERGEGRGEQGEGRGEQGEGRSEQGEGRGEQA